VTYKAFVRNGRIVLDEPTDLPDGCEVELALVRDDDLEDEDRARLHEALAESEADETAGRLYDAEEVLGQLASDRSR